MKTNRDKGELLTDALNQAYRTDSTTFFWDDATEKICLSVYQVQSGCYTSFEITKKDIKDALKYALTAYENKRKNIIPQIKTALKKL